MIRSGHSGYILKKVHAVFINRLIIGGRKKLF